MSAENVEFELVTASIAPDELLKQIAVIADLLRAAAVAEVVVEYGWGCNLPTSSLWQATRVSTDLLASFAGEAVQAGIFRPGAADLIVSDPARAVQVIFCHESDIHLKTDNSAMVESFLATWTRAGITVRTRREGGTWTVL